MKIRPRSKQNVVLLSPHAKTVTAVANKSKPIKIATGKKVVMLPNQRSLIMTKPNYHQSARQSQRPDNPVADWPKIGRGVATGGIILILIALGYGLFCSPYFKARSVAIEGAQLLEANTLRQQAETVLSGHFWQIWRGNFWLVSTAQFCDSLQDYNLASCHLSRRWPNKLTLKIQEEPVVAIWQENGWFYWVDKLGRVVKQELPNQASVKLYPVVNNIGQDTLVDEHQVVVNQDLWSFIINSQVDWLGAAPRTFSFSNQEANSIQAISANQQVIKLTLRLSLTDQLKLWQTGQSKFAAELSQAKVIDLRYGDRIIYQ
jgi:hypothetical protein